MRTRCTNCGCVVETIFGADRPGTHDPAAGTDEDPRAPGDWDNVCEVCGYVSGVRGTPISERDLASQPDPSSVDWSEPGAPDA
jgi:hypothetical protein